MHALDATGAQPYLPGALTGCMAAPSDDASLGHVRTWSDGFSWIAHPNEDARRASHALATDAGVLVVDPVDAPGLDDRLTALGTVAGVVVAQDRHTRDAAAVAARHDVAVYVAEWMTLAREKLATDAAPLAVVLSETTYDARRLVDAEDWEEVALVDASGETVLVPETLGTLSSFDAADADRLGVHPALDDPSRALAGLTPTRVLVGHGESVHEDATASLRAAVGADD